MATDGHHGTSRADLWSVALLVLSALVLVAGVITYLLLP